MIRKAISGLRGLPVVADLLDRDLEVGDPAIADEGLKDCAICSMKQLRKLIDIGVLSLPLPLHKRKRILVVIADYCISAPSLLKQGSSAKKRGALTHDQSKMDRPVGAPATACASDTGKSRYHIQLNNVMKSRSTRFICSLSVSDSSPFFRLSWLKIESGSPGECNDHQTMPPRNSDPVQG